MLYSHNWDLVRARSGDNSPIRAEGNGPYMAQSEQVDRINTPVAASQSRALLPVLPVGTSSAIGAEGHGVDLTGHAKRPEARAVAGGRIPAPRGFPSRPPVPTMVRPSGLKATARMLPWVFQNNLFQAFPWFCIPQSKGAVKTAAGGQWSRPSGLWAWGQYRPLAILVVQDHRH